MQGHCAAVGAVFCPRETNLLQVEPLGEYSLGRLAKARSVESLSMTEICR
jgi:hypothetical protein